LHLFFISLRKVIPDFMNEKPMAYHCYLYNIKPIDTNTKNSRETPNLSRSTKLNYKWSRKAISLLEQLDCDKSYIINIVEIINDKEEQEDFFGIDVCSTYHKRIKEDRLTNSTALLYNIQAQSFSQALVKCRVANYEIEPEESLLKSQTNYSNIKFSTLRTFFSFTSFISFLFNF
jgi:hypothetical protein